MAASAILAAVMSPGAGCFRPTIQDGGLTVAFPAEFETTRALAQKLEEMVVYNLPDDTYQSFVGAVQKVAVADVQKAAARYIQSDKMAVVIVGDLKAIEPGVKALNLGPIRVVPIEEFFK